MYEDQTELASDGLAGWRDRAALNIHPEASAVLGIGRSSAYQLVRSGELPTIRLGGRRVVPVMALRRMLGEVQ